MSFTKVLNIPFFSSIISKNSKGLLNILFVIFFGYFLFGVVPFAPYEEDSLGVMMGSKRIIETGVFAAHEISYGFQLQPGTYFWIVLLNKISGLSVLYCYSIVSAFFGIGFLFLSILFLQKITNLHFSLCGLILLLFQETYSAWYYCNSAVIAGAFMMLAFNILLRRSSGFYLVMSGVLLGIAAWSRADIMIFYPVSLFIILAEKWRERLLKTAVLAIITLAFANFLYWFNNLSILDLISNLASTQKTFTIAYNMKTSSGPLWSMLSRSYLGFFSGLLVFLILMGTLFIIKNRHWLKLAILLTPVLMFLIILKGNITASKHLFYFVPFFAVPVIINFEYFKEFGNKLKVTFILASISLFLLQYVLGIQIFFNTNPYIGQSYASVSPNPTYLEISHLNLCNSRIDSIKLVIGGGMKLSTDDEMMLSSGILFSPMMWHNLKNQCNENINGLKKFINNYPKDSLKILTTQSSNIYVDYILSDLNYLLKTNSERLSVWEKNNKTILVYYAYYPKKMGEYIKLIISNDLKESIFIPYWDWEKYFVLNSGLNYTRINDISYYFNK